MKNKFAKITTVTSSLLFALQAFASQSFDFKDPKGVNNISFSLDAPLESISGTGNAISGTVMFDPAKPEETSGKIYLKTSSLRVTNSVMQDHMLSSGWLDAEKYEDIIFEALSLSQLKQSGNKVEANITGKLTLKGVTKEITVPIKIAYLPGKLSARTNGRAEGDLLVLRSSFTVNRSDFGIKSGEMTDKVAEEIELKMAIAGAAPKA